MLDRLERAGHQIRTLSAAQVEERHIQEPGPSWQAHIHVPEDKIQHLRGRNAGEYAAQKPNTNRTLVDLALAEEALNDLLSRPKEFNSRSESILMLIEMKELIFRLLNAEDDRTSRLQQQIQAIASKLCYAYIKLDYFRDARAFTLNLVQSWTTELEASYRPLWRPVVALAYSKKQYNLSSYLAKMVTKHSGLQDEWMSLANLQSLLRMAERNESHKFIGRADSIWMDYEKANLPVPSSVVLLVLDSQVRRRDVDKVRQILQLMRGYNFEITRDAWRVLLLPSLHCSPDAEVIRTLLDFVKDPTSVVIGLVTTFADEDNLRGCLRTLHTFGISSGARSIDRAPAVSLTLDIYRPIISMFGRHKQADYAIRFLDLALARKSAGDYTPLFIHIAGSLNAKGRAEDALYLGSKLMMTPLPALATEKRTIADRSDARVMECSRRVYSMLLQSTSLLSDFFAIVPTARIILLHLFRQGKVLNHSVRRSLVRIVQRIGRTARTTPLLTRLVKELRSMSEASDEDEVTAIAREEWSKFLQVAQREGVGDFFTLEAWKRAGSRERLATRQRTAEQGLEGSRPTEWPFHHRTGLQETERLGSMSNGLLQRPQLRDLDLSVVASAAAYAMRLRVFAVVRRDFASARIIYRSMLSHGIKPSMHHIAPLIQGLVLLNRTEEAHDIKRRVVKELGSKVTSRHVYAALIRGHGQLHNWQGLTELSQEMAEDGVEMTASFLQTFRLARKMLKKSLADPSQVHQQNKSGLMARLDTFLGQKGLSPVRDGPMTVESVSSAFQFFHNQQRAYLSAQLHVARALREGVQPDHVLRAQLRRSRNWLRKELDHCRGKDNSRRRKFLSHALQKVEENIVRAKGTDEENQRTNALRDRENDQREKLIKLLRDAVGSNRLKDQAEALRDEEDHLVVFEKNDGQSTTMPPTTSA